MGSYSSFPCLLPHSLLPSRTYILFESAMYIYALLLLPRWYRTNGHKNKYGAQTAHVEVLKPHAGKTEVNNQLSSRELSLLQRREKKDICASKAIKPFSKQF